MHSTSATTERFLFDFRVRVRHIADK